MKFLFDLFPVILFFAMFKWGEGHVAAAQSLGSTYLSGLVSGGVVSAEQAPILLATSVVMLATFAQIAYLLLRRKKIDAMLWISLVIITVFGGATIYFHNPTFIKWKPTVLYWSFTLMFLISQFVMKKNVIKTMMGGQVDLPTAVWNRLNLAWAAFFLMMGVLNLYVAFNYSQSTWVTFKSFGGMGLMFVFVLAQSVFLSKHLQEPK
ncbi:MAG: septation protein A [Pseudomonadota bacterium]|nr:septation protein A [Pseudomonadota bacterium]